MPNRRPPALARWVLSHFGSSPNNAAVIGDLNERYLHGRSRRWYWRQVVWAIVASFFKEIWWHKALAIRAFVISWTIKVAWLSVFWYVYGRPPRLATIEASLFVFLMGIIAMMSTAWIIAQTHRVHYRPMVLLYLLLEVIGPLLAFISKGALGVYYWGPPLWQVIYSIQAHLEIFNSVAAAWTSTLIMIVTILVGGGFLTNRAESNSADHRSAPA